MSFKKKYLHMILAAMCYGIASLPPNFGESMNCVQISISLTILKRVLPLSLVFVAMITFNNLCLKFVGVSFYYIGNYFEHLKYFLKNIVTDILKYFSLHQVVP